MLIFQAFDIVSIEEIGKDYIWKAACSLFAIYFFFVSERFLKIFLKAREVRSPPPPFTYILRCLAKYY